MISFSLVLIKISYKDKRKFEGVQHTVILCINNLIIINLTSLFHVQKIQMSCEDTLPYFLKLYALYYQTKRVAGKHIFN